MGYQETDGHGNLSDFDAGNDHLTATGEIHHIHSILKRRSPPDRDQKPTPRKKVNFTNPIQPSKFSLHRPFSAPPPENIYTNISGSPPQVGFSDSSVRRSSPNVEKMKKLEEMTKEISVWREKSKRKMQELEKIKKLDVTMKEISMWCEKAMRLVCHEEEEEPQELKEEEESASE